MQRNKVKLAASLFDCIQSVDRESLAAELAKVQKPVSLLLEYRTGEDSKSGFTGFDELYKTVDLILEHPVLSIRGLMTIAPNTREEGVLRTAFRRLAALRSDLERRYPARAGCLQWDCLSMGMSGDFEIAIEEGSTMLRIGSAIFSRD